MAAEFETPTTVAHEAPQAATIITHDPTWREPVIPVVAGITGWNMADFDGFTHWYARPGEVVLGVWTGWWEENYTVVASREPASFEVTLPVAEHTALLLDLLATGCGTLAVLEFGGGESEPPMWGEREVGIDGLAEAIREAGRGR